MRVKSYQKASDVNVMSCSAEEEAVPETVFCATGYETIFAKRAPKQNNRLEAARISEIQV